MGGNQVYWRTCAVVARLDDLLLRDGLGLWAAWHWLGDPVCPRPRARRLHAEELPGLQWPRLALSPTFHDTSPRQAMLMSSRYRYMGA